MNITQLLEELTIVEAFKDIPTTNKLYHQTNAYNLFKIMETGFLMSRQFRFGTENLKSMYQERTSPKEIATGRRSTYSEIDNLKGKDKQETMSSLSRNIGNVRFELYKDRLKSSKYVRGLKIKPIAEFDISERNEMKNILDKYKISEKEAKDLIKKVDFTTWHKRNFMALIREKPYLNRLLEKDMKAFFEALKTLSHYRIYKENEERLVFTGKNETKYRDDLLNDKNDRIYLNAELMKVYILGDFVKELATNIAPNSYIKYYNMMKRWKDLFIKDANYKKAISFFEDFKAGKITQEELVKLGVKESNIKKYMKATGHTYLPNKEEIEKEAGKYNKKTGAKKLQRSIHLKITPEQLKKDVEETKKKIASAGKN